MPRQKTAPIEQRIAHVQERIAAGEAARVEREEIVAELRGQGWSMMAIAEMVDVSDVAVLKILRRRGIT